MLKIEVIVDAPKMNIQTGLNTQMETGDARVAELGAAKLGAAELGAAKLGAAEGWGGSRLLALLAQQPDFLSWIDYAIAAQLRRSCRAARAAVARFPWDLDQNISRIAGARDPSKLPKGPYGNHAYEFVANWQRCCPRARQLTVDKTSLLHGDGARLAGLRRLDIRSEAGAGALQLLNWSRRIGFDFDLDNALAYARGLRELRVECGGAKVIASASAFVALEALERLEILGTFCGHPRAPACSLEAIFAPLAALESLTIVDCGRDFGSAPGGARLGGACLGGLRRLELLRCQFVALTDDVLLAMTGLLELKIESCPNAELTPRAFAGLARLRRLTVKNCRRVEFSDAAFAGLADLRSVCIAGCRTRLTGEFRRHLSAECRVAIDDNDASVGRGVYSWRI